MLLLAPFQITPTTATKIYDHFGAHSVDILRDNPFELCQISGFGFKRVDAIMRKNNWPLNSPMRIRGAVFAALEGAKGDGGHLYLDAEQLRKESMALLNSMIPVPQMRVKADDLEAVIDDMLLQGKIINSNGNYYLVKTFAQEDETARSIARLLCRPVERVDVQDLLTRVRRQLGVELSLQQTEAVHMVFRSDLSIITGSPGTGKTTVLKAVIEVFKLLKPSENILLAAPTGRASRRMAESTGVNNASTLHSLLGLFGEDGGFRKCEEDKASNGDIGFIRSFRHDERDGMRISIQFSPTRVVEYSMEEMGHVELAYATTVHKAQGSEFDVVLFPLLRSHARMLTRSLVYTAITRAKSKVILVGQIGMLYMAVHKDDTGKRNTQLGHRISLYTNTFKVQQRSA